jgi:ribosomal protein L1
MMLRGDHNPSKKDQLKHLVEAALKVSTNNYSQSVDVDIVNFGSIIA